MNKFPHIDENVIISTYFEQTNCNADETIKLLRVQFPADPAFQNAKLEPPQQIPVVYSPQDDLPQIEEMKMSDQPDVDKEFFAVGEYSSQIVPQEEGRR